MEITHMDREAAKVLSAALREVIELVAAEHGLDFKVGGGSFSPHDGTYKPRIEFSVPAVKAAAANQSAEWMGIPDAVGRRFEFRGKTYEITGVNPRARKMPIQATELASGRSFKFPTSTVKHCLEAS
jgi:hypothetical protein